MDKIVQINGSQFYLLTLSPALQLSWHRSWQWHSRSSRLSMARHQCSNARKGWIINSFSFVVDSNLRHDAQGIRLFFPVSYQHNHNTVQTIMLRLDQLDPAPGATIGGMIATGCSGSAWRDRLIWHPHRTTSSANAVRYGTAKGEWFLNAVSKHNMLKLC